MKTIDFIESTDKFLEEALSTLKRKGREYATNENFFANFEQAIGISFCDTKEAVLWHYLTKHLQSVKDMINTVEVGEGIHGHFDTKHINEKIGDSINYLLILRAMLENRVEEYTVNKLNEKSYEESRSFL
jgi:hypothetical protein